MPVNSNVPHVSQGDSSNSVSRKNLPPLGELIAICGGEGTAGRNEPRDFRRLYARGVRRLSIRITRLLLPTGISANQTTVLGILIGIGGGLLLAVNEFWAQLLAIVLIQLAFVLDFCDGELARFEREIEGKSSGAGGAYLDWVGHYYMPAAITAGLAWGVFSETGDWWWPAAGLVVILSLVRVPFSARDHIMWGVYRDRPELRESDAMVRAALARMGGDPSELKLDAAGAEAMAGGKGRGLLWGRATNLGQLIVFPGFINLVAAASVIDMLISWLVDDASAVTSVWARAVLLAALAAVHLLHQLRATVQSYQVTKQL